MGPLLFRRTGSLPPQGLGTLGLVEHACPLRLGTPGHGPVPPVAAPSLQSWLWPDRLRQQSSLAMMLRTQHLYGERACGFPAACVRFLALGLWWTALW